jgi:hypothetical protein
MAHHRYYWRSLRGSSTHYLLLTLSRVSDSFLVLELNVET